jgi:SAM-dependent methyltransferase
VLEVADSEYTRRYGGADVALADVLDIDPGNTLATFVDDLAVGTSIPSDTFDCLLLTQTLHLIYDAPAAVATAHRILRPGGVLVATFPGLSQVVDADWGLKDTWYWGFTSRSARRMFEECFGAGSVEIEVFGNVLSTTAFLYGIAAEELQPSELETRDGDYELLIGVRAVKPQV